MTWINSQESLAWVSGVTFLNSASNESKKILEIQLLKEGEFNSAAFNQNLNNFLIAIQKFRSTFEHLLSSDIQELSISSAFVFVNLYTKVSIKLKTMRPLGMPDETFKDFHAAMLGIASTFEKSSHDFRKKTSSLVLNKSLLSPSYRIFASFQNIEHPSSATVSSLIMDKNFKD
jgi:hypothetical protein